MSLIKYISMLMLTLSIVVAGLLPVQAKAGCQMAVEMQMENVADCQGCDKTTKHEQKKNSCCDSNQCSSSSMSMNLSTMQSTTAIGTQARIFYPADAVIMSAHLNSGERPPKSLV